MKCISNQCNLVQEAGARRIGGVRDYLICYGKIVFGILNEVSGSSLRFTFKFPGFVFGVLQLKAVNHPANYGGLRQLKLNNIF